MSKAYSQHYLAGIVEGRKWMREHGDTVFQRHLEIVSEIVAKYPSRSPQGQMFRGERDFLLNYGKKNGLI